MSTDAVSEMEPASGSRDHDGHTVRLTIPARPEYVTLCRLALTGITRLRPISDETVADLKLALTEAASNSVRHAYAKGHDGVVTVVYKLHPDRLAIEVSDDGGGFDFGAPRNGSEVLSEGGLGIAIIRAIADEVEIGPSVSGRGSCLRFVKKLT